MWFSNRFLLVVWSKSPESGQRFPFYAPLADLLTILNISFLFIIPFSIDICMSRFFFYNFTSFEISYFQESILCLNCLLLSVIVFFVFKIVCDCDTEDITKYFSVIRAQSRFPWWVGHLSSLAFAKLDTLPVLNEHSLHDF